jgi:predicted PurR-regulated permease PerM
LDSSTRRFAAGSWFPAALALAGLWAVYRLRHVLLLFVLAGGAAAALDPIVKYFIRRTSLPRWAISTGLFFVVLAGTAGAGWWGYEKAAPLARRLVTGRANEAHAFVARSFNGEQLTILGHTLEARNVADRLVAEAKEKLGPHPSQTAGLVAVGAAAGAILFFVLFFYFLLQGPDLAQGALKLAPPEARPRVWRVAERAYPMLQRYFAGLFVVVAFTSLTTWACIGPIFHLPCAAALAVLTGFLELIPVIGPTVSMTLLSIAAVMRGGSAWSLVGFGIFCFVLRFGIDQVVGPVVLGRAVKLPPVVVIFAFLGGGALLGPLGMLIAIPSVALARIVLEDCYAAR